MFCETCSKLAILHSNSSCRNCKGAVYNNLSVICDVCSKRNNTCSACLRKLYNKIIVGGGCKTCGKR